VLSTVIIKENMTQKNNYNFKKNQVKNFDFPAEEIRQELKRKKGIVNIIVSEDAPVEEKIKYNIGQSILNYHLKTKKSFAVMVKEIALADITEKKLIDICRGKINDFSLGELIVSALNLRIYSIPCLDCGGDILPILLGNMVYSLKKQENLPTKIPNIYQALEKHQVLVHRHL
jgi:hypothetical protein